MRTLILVLIASLCALSYTSAQQAGRQSPIEAMVHAERNFSRIASEKGIQTAFLTFLSDEGIILKPEPVNGKQLYQERGNQPGLLVWEPIFAIIAASGDFGFTTGPWSFKKQSTDSIPAAYGNFASIWKKQPDDSWKVAVDLGISNPAPNSKPVLQVAESAAPKLAPTQSRKNQAKNLGLLAYDNAFSRFSEKNGVLQAYRSYANDSIRLLRMNHQPFIGKEMLGSVFTAETGKLTWKAEVTEMAGSHDLGYTYGSFTRFANDGTSIEKGYYMRVWKHNSKSDWLLLFDILLATNPEKNTE